jgi:radical SAM-linked protein
MRLLMKFAKTKAMQYTSHLDLHRTLERTMRRANLPLSYSQGYNPRPKIVLASALPLGYTSLCEFAEFWLDKEIDLLETVKALRAASPPGIELLELTAVENKAPKSQNMVASAEFMVTLLAPKTDLAEQVAFLLAQEELVRSRLRKGKIKEYDLRALIEELSIASESEWGQQRLFMRLKALPGATGRPDEVLESLEINPFDAQVERTAIILKT